MRKTAARTREDLNNAYRKLLVSIWTPFIQPDVACNPEQCLSDLKAFLACAFASPGESGYMFRLAMGIMSEEWPLDNASTFLQGAARMLGTAVSQDNENHDACRNALLGIWPGFLEKRLYPARPEFTKVCSNIMRADARRAHLLARPTRAFMTMASEALPVKGIRSLPSGKPS